MARSSILELFPAELLEMIRKAIPQGDLRAHVCFYLSFPPVTSSLYGDEEQEERFWETACIQSGLGLLPGETGNPHAIRWKDVALECITGDGFCAHQKCGGELLEANGEHDTTAEDGNDALNSFSADDMHDLIDENLTDVSRTEFHSIIPDEPDVYPSGTVVNTILNWIDFCSTKPLHNDYFLNDVYLFSQATQDAHGKQNPADQLLRFHRIAARSFACFPPSRKVTVQGPFRDGYVTAENAFGVTVWDIQYAIHARSVVAFVSDAPLLMTCL